MNTIAVLSWSLALIGQAAPTPGTDPGGDPATRLEAMKRSVASYEVHPLDDPRTTLRLQAEPIMRFTNPVGGSPDGAIFLWLDATDRPWAAVQVFMRRDGLWFQEFTSLGAATPGCRVASRTQLGAERAGVAFQPIPAAPKPAETSERRMQQLRTFAAGFSAEDAFQRKPFQPLRLLPKPLIRYGKPAETLDVPSSDLC